MVELGRNEAAMGLLPSKQTGTGVFWRCWEVGHKQGGSTRKNWMRKVWALLHGPACLGRPKSKEHTEENVGRDTNDWLEPVSWHWSLEPSELGFPSHHRLQQTFHREGRKLLEQTLSWNLPQSWTSSNPNVFLRLQKTPGLAFLGQYLFAFCLTLEARSGSSKSPLKTLDFIYFFTIFFACPKPENAGMAQAHSPEISRSKSFRRALAKHRDFSILTKPRLQSLAICSYAFTFSSVLRHCIRHSRWPYKDSKKLHTGRSSALKFLPPQYHPRKKKNLSGKMVYSVYFV